MRRGVLSFVTALLLASPAGAQVCNRTPPPFLPGLFPETVKGLDVQFSSAPGMGCMAMYRATESGAIWAMVSADANPSLPLGESAPDLQKHYEGAGKPVITVDGWPILVSYLPKGDEFVTLKGAVQLSVLVKNGDQGAKSQELATAFLQALLPKVPCGG
jgi:hypothetical protein